MQWREGGKRGKSTRCGVLSAIYSYSKMANEHFNRVLPVLYLLAVSMWVRRLLERERGARKALLVGGCIIFIYGEDVVKGTSSFYRSDRVSVQVCRQMVFYKTIYNYAIFHTFIEVLCWYFEYSHEYNISVWCWCMVYSGGVWCMVYVFITSTIKSN